MERQPRHGGTDFMQEMWLEWSQRDKQREHWTLFLGCIDNQYMYTSDTCIGVSPEVAEKSASLAMYFVVARGWLVWW